MTKPQRILIKTTIPTAEDDWHVGRFSLLAAHLASLAGDDGAPLYAVTARDRTQTPDGDDADIADAADGAYDQLWLFAVDVTGALTPGDSANIERFRSRGGGAFLTRDHQDLGYCLTCLGALGQTQHFQTVNPDPDVSRRCIDDRITTAISWPNYHSGANGDFHAIEVEAPLHPLMRRASGEPIRFLPSHPHEGAVGPAAGLGALSRVVATGRSQTTGVRFNLMVAVEEPGMGRAVSDASFHHVCNYNWDPALGCPSFVSEPPGDGLSRSPEAASDARRYAENVAAWLARAI